MAPSRATEGVWRRAVLLVLLVVACASLPLGVGEGAGAASAVPSLHAPALTGRGRPIAHPSAQPQTARPPAPVRGRSFLLPAAVALVVGALGLVLVLHATDDVRTGLGPATLRARGPPTVL